MQPIASAFKDHILHQGLTLVGKVDFNQEDQREHSKIKVVLNESQLIEHLVAMLEKYQTMVKACFKGQAIFERSRHTAFEGFLNKDRDSDKTSMSEILAIYTDTILRKGGMKAV